MNELVLLVPEAAAPKVEAAVISERGLQRGELRLGILDNSKANADHLLRMVADQVRAAHAVKSVLTLRKSSVAMAARPEVIEQLVNDCDLVLSAMAD
jgi:site-specific recombinase